MSFEGWLIFVAFWIIFVTTPGPNAANCIQNGMTFGFRRSLWGVLAILTQATAFLLLSAAGVTALIVALPEVFFWVQLAGAALLVFLGVRAWLNARNEVKMPGAAGSIYGRALAIATINAKSLAGYLAAFSQFVQPDVAIWVQMQVIMPTALTLTAISYVGYTALGAGLGRAALGAVFNTWVRRGLAACFVIYGALLGASALPGRAA
ncbi:LysE family translocator [Shimia ponticola]|uniref:LysE family translocator n=1 Tax=Shimia ponticola TaxID=2582893 RepID=UPI0011BE2ADD|nr:LysE family translocator [Shimia ponticola]